MAGQLKVNGVTLATENASVITLENPQIKDSSNNLVLDQSGSRPLLKNVDIKDSSNNLILDQSGSKAVLKNVEVVNDSSMMFRNRIINGDMRISQRGTSSSFAHDGTTNGFTLDRFKIFLHNTDQYDCTVSQYSMTSAETNITGHSHSLKLLTGTAESAIDNDEYVRFQYIPESQDVQDFLHGTASAKTITLSFWVKSSITGTFGFNLYRYVSSGTARIINLSYTINSADTWEHKTIQIPGDTGGNLVPNDTTGGFLLIWQLASGSDRYSTAATSWGDYATTRLMGNHSNAVITTASADWYLTGVQLEVGNQATSFEHRPYGMELSLCQRYFEKIKVNGLGTIGVYSTGAGGRFYTGLIKYSTQKRASPSVSITATNSYWVQSGAAVYSASGPHTFTAHGSDIDGHSAYSNRPSGGSTPSGTNVYLYEHTVTHSCDAEL